jgi:flavoprotein
MRHEARRSKLEGKLFPHSPKIGWCVHRAGHVLSTTLDIFRVMVKYY